MMARTAKAGFHIGVTCPGCGGDLELQEDFFSLECSYCGSVLRIVMPETPPVFIIRAKKQEREIRFQIDRYLKQNKLPLTRADFDITKIYYPYWKVNAIRLRLQKQKVIEKPQIDYNTADMAFYGLGAKVTRAVSSMSIEETKIRVNLSRYGATQTAGAYISGIPASLGLRTEYIKALPFSTEVAESDCGYFPVSLTWDRVRANMIKGSATKARLNVSQGGAARNELFNLSGSIVYFPYLLAVSDTASDIDYFIVDGLSGRVVYAGPIPEEFPGGGSTAESLSGFARLKVEFHRCHNCGVDLPASRSAVYICHNCSAVIALDNNQHLAKGMHEVDSDPACPDRKFPFWSFTVDPELVRGLINPITGAENYDRLLVPAFRIPNFEAMHRLCRRITGGISQFSLHPVERHDNRFLPVDIGLREALSLGEIILYRELVSKNPSLMADAVNLNASQASIVFVPFRPQNYFYSDSVKGDITFEKSLIELPAI